MSCSCLCSMTACHWHASAIQESYKIVMTIYNSKKSIMTCSAVCVCMYNLDAQRSNEGYVTAPSNFPHLIPITSHHSTLIVNLDC